MRSAAARRADCAGTTLSQCSKLVPQCAMHHACCQKQPACTCALCHTTGTELPLGVRPHCCSDSLQAFTSCTPEGHYMNEVVKTLANTNYAVRNFGCAINCRGLAYHVCFISGAVTWSKTAGPLSAQAHRRVKQQQRGGREGELPGGQCLQVSSGRPEQDCGPPLHDQEPGGEDTRRWCGYMGVASNITHVG